MAYDDIYRVIASQSLAVATVGGASASTAVFGSQTYAIDIVFVAAAGATAGCRFNIGGPNDAVSSTQGALLPPNWIQRFKVTPGQRVIALSNDASAIASLNVVELSK